MDYGKLAYMKAEELEARLTTPSPSTAVSAGFTPDASAKGLALTSVRLSGSAVVLCKVVFFCEADTTASVALKFDGKTAADAEIALTAGEPKTELLMGCVQYTGEAELTLDCSDGRILVKRVEIGLLGASAAVTRETSDFRFARGDTFAAAALASSQTITAYPIERAIGAGKAVCRGLGFDLCATADGYALLYTDAVGNLWLRQLNTALDTVACSRIGDAIDSPTVCFTGGRLTAAGVVGGKAYVFGAAAGATRFLLDFPDAVDSVYFVKNAPRPILAVTSGGKVFLKSVADRALGMFAVAVRPTLFAVSDWEDEYSCN